MTNKITLNEAYWSSRYQENETGWDIGCCSTPLKEYFEQLDNKSMSILVPGAGFGHEVKYLFDLGFRNVHVVDLAKEPLENLKLNCPDFPENQLHHEDFFEHNGQYDLIVEQTFFCALDLKLRAQYVRKMRELLKPNGKLVGLLFNRDFEGGPPFGGNVQEYHLLFETQFQNVVINPCYNSIEARKGSEVFINIS